MMEKKPVLVSTVTEVLRTRTSSSISSIVYHFYLNLLLYAYGEKILVCFSSIFFYSQIAAHHDSLTFAFVTRGRLTLHTRPPP